MKKQRLYFGKMALLAVTVIFLTAAALAPVVDAAEVPPPIKSGTEKYSGEGDAKSVADLVCQNRELAEEIVIIALETNASLAKALLREIELAKCLSDEQIERIKELVNELLAGEERDEVRPEQRQNPYGQ
jgi:hypothetical protein